MRNTTKAYTFSQMAREYLRVTGGEARLADELLSPKRRDDQQLREGLRL